MTGLFCIRIHFGIDFTLYKGCKSCKHQAMKPAPMVASNSSPTDLDLLEPIPKKILFQATPSKSGISTSNMSLRHVSSSMSCLAGCTLNVPTLNVFGVHEPLHAEVEVADSDPAAVARGARPKRVRVVQAAVAARPRGRRVAPSRKIVVRPSASWFGNW